MPYQRVILIILCVSAAAVVFPRTLHPAAPQVRVYKEVVVAPPEMAAMSDHPSTGSSLKWQTPKGWQEQPASGMRMASFTGGDSTDPVECLIVRLSGPAGGKEANIRRWLGQIQLSDLTDSELQAFLNRQEKLSIDKTYPATLVDFTQLQTDLPNEAPSTIAVIIEMADDSVFVKMTGSKAAVKNHVEQLKELALSIRPGESL